MGNGKQFNYFPIQPFNLDSIFLNNIVDIFYNYVYNDTEDQAERERELVYFL